MGEGEDEGEGVDVRGIWEGVRGRWVRLGACLGMEAH